MKLSDQAIRFMRDRWTSVQTLAEELFAVFRAITDNPLEFTKPVTFTNDTPGQPAVTIDQIADGAPAISIGGSGNVGGMVLNGGNYTFNGANMTLNGGTLTLNGADLLVQPAPMSDPPIDPVTGIAVPEPGSFTFDTLGNVEFTPFPGFQVDESGNMLPLPTVEPFQFGDSPAGTPLIDASTGDVILGGGNVIINGGGEYVVGGDQSFSLAAGQNVNSTTNVNIQAARPTDSAGNRVAVNVSGSAGGGGGMPGQIVSGSGDTYTVRVYPSGLNAGSLLVTVKQLSISSDESIPVGAWTLIAKAGGSYYMQFPTWQE